MASSEATSLSHAMAASEMVCATPATSSSSRAVSGSPSMSFSVMSTIEACQSARRFSRRLCDASSTALIAAPTRSLRSLHW
nr:hypothetical protein [Deltaproteobacteria bacterium]